MLTAEYNFEEALEVASEEAREEGRKEGNEAIISYMFKAKKMTDKQISDFTVNAILDAVENLALVVKGNLDNAEPLFVIGGMSARKTHFFENVVNIRGNSLILEDGIKEKLASNKGKFKAAVLKCGKFDNEDKIVSELNAVTTEEFFENLKKEVKEYYA